MIKFLSKLFRRTNSVFYIANGGEILPEKLDAKEEYMLVEEMKNGSEEARNQLI